MQTIDKKENEIGLYEHIQPLGGITFRDESVVKTGDGYETCLHVVSYPKEPDDFWLSKVANIPNSVTTIDISTKDINVVKKNINRSMKEQNTRYRHATDYSSESEAETKFQEMKDLMDEVTKLQEVPKTIDTRIFLSDHSWLQLDEKTKKAKESLGNEYLSFVNLNETKSDWCSMYQSYQEQQKNRYATEGQFTTATSIAGGNPFYFSSLEDPSGSFYGTTQTGGNVFWDVFYKSRTRRFYNGFCVGTMGAGKSTILKKIFEDRAIRGDYVRAFDVSGEFTNITLNFGGKIMKLDGTDENSLNPLEILRGGNTDDISYSRHAAKLNTFYRFLVPDSTQEEVVAFSNSINALYEKWGLTPGQEQPITGRPAAEYPIFSDYHELLEQQKQQLAAGEYNEVDLELAKHEALLLDKIDKTILYIIKTYGKLFNQHTSMDNILDEQIVTFDISKLKDMDAQIFDAQLSNILSLCWDNCVTNGKMMYELFRDKRLTLEEIIYFLILIDESHRSLNAHKLQMVDMITVYMREARKYFGGIVLASQSIRDYVPENSSPEALDKLKTIFELTQYKLIFHQDSTLISVLRDTFDNVLTEAQLNRIPYLEQGSCIMSIASDINLEFNVFITDEEEYLFSGGV